MKSKLLQVLGSFLGLLLFAASLWVLHHELRAYHYHDLVRNLRSLPSSRLSLALVLTVFSYAALTGYDAVACLYIRHPLAYKKIALASFIGYAFSNNIGYSPITGGPVRYRLYSAWGLSAEEITKVVAFCVITFWLGLLTLGSLVFLLEPLAIPASLPLPFSSARPIGIIFLVLMGGFLLWATAREKPITVREWEFPIPSLGLSLAQIAVASLDWALAGAVLYVLLPTGAVPSLPRFLGIFLLAQTAGLASQVPGGIGVFETAIILLLPPTVPRVAVLGSLLAYRVVYYLIPLGVAALLLGTYELLQRKEGVKRLARVFGQWAPELVPHVLAFTTFAGGAIMIFSGATPAVSSRLAWLKDFLPLPAIETGHFLGSLAGVGLLLLARGLQRRVDAAYHLTALLLGAGIVFSLLRGFDYEEALALSVMLGALLPCRRHFYRRASLISQRFTAGWMTAIAAVLLASIWLGMFSYKHVEYSHDLWWHFALLGNAPRFLRANAGALGAVLLFSIARLLRPVPPEPDLPAPADLDRAQAVVALCSDTSANLALLGDKPLLFSDNGRAFIMYGVEGRSWVALRDPVGPEEEGVELVWRFREMCDRHNGWPIFYEVSKDVLPLYVDLGLTLLKLGEEARVPLEAFSLEGGARKGLRRTSRTIEKEGCSFEVIPPEGVSVLLPEFRQISDKWLAEKNTSEKGFSLGSFKEDYIKRFPAAVVRREEKVLAFANVLCGAGKEELSVDLMRYLPEAPHGVMEYLFLKLMLWGGREGYRWFNLGMAPLSGLDDHALSSLWSRVGTIIFRYGEHFYNFQGLRQYKEKFDPEWEPKYLASPGGLALPRILSNIASLISGGLKGAIAK